MNKVILDVSTVAKLEQMKQGAEICDPAGRVVGFFTPTAESPVYEIEDPPSREELDQFEQSGRPLDEIMKDLEGKP